MPGIGLKKVQQAMKKRWSTRRREGYRELTLQNVWASTSPLDVVLLLWLAGFHPADAEVVMLFADVVDLAQANVSLPKREVRAVQKWAKGRWWRGLELYVRVDDEDDTPEGRETKNENLEPSVTSQGKSGVPSRSQGRKLSIVGNEKDIASKP